MKSLSHVALVLVLFVFSFAQGAEELTGPALELKKDMETLFEFSKKVNSENATEKSEARAKLDGAMDWDRAAQDCLGAANWKKQSAKNREDFKRLLKDVIIRTAYTRLDKFWPGMTYGFDKVDIKGNTAHVIAKFTSKNESTPLDYYLTRKGGKWAIYDIAYEGERYSVNINEQIDAFLREKSFANLLEKLKKRRDDLIKDEAKNKKA